MNGGKGYCWHRRSASLYVMSSTPYGDVKAHIQLAARQNALGYWTAEAVNRGAVCFAWPCSTLERAKELLEELFLDFERFQIGGVS